MYWFLTHGIIGIIENLSRGPWVIQTSRTLAKRKWFVLVIRRHGLTVLSCFHLLLLLLLLSAVAYICDDLIHEFVYWNWKSFIELKLLQFDTNHSNLSDETRNLLLPVFYWQWLRDRGKWMKNVLLDYLLYAISTWQWLLVFKRETLLPNDNVNTRNRETLSKQKCF